MEYQYDNRVYSNRIVYQIEELTFILCIFLHLFCLSLSLSLYSNLESNSIWNRNHSTVLLNCLQLDLRTESQQGIRVRIQL